MDYYSVVREITALIPDFEKWDIMYRQIFDDKKLARLVKLMKVSFKRTSDLYAALGVADPNFLVKRGASKKPLEEAAQENPKNIEEPFDLNKPIELQHESEPPTLQELKQLLGTMRAQRDEKRRRVDMYVLSLTQRELDAEWRERYLAILALAHALSLD